MAMLRAVSAAMDFNLLLGVLLALGSGLVGGVFFAFSTFVMRALADLPPAQGAAAMRRINVVALNPAFLGAFLGTAVLSVATIFMAAAHWSDAGAPLRAAAGVAYPAGSFGVTMAANVPRNDRLARLAAASPEAAEYWPVYVREWTLWNHIRTAASLLAAAAAAAGLAL